MNARVFPATAAQGRLCLMPRRLNNDGSLNVMTRLRITGPLDVERLERALRQVIDRHSALRCTFALDGEQVVQVVHAGPAAGFFRVLDRAELPAPAPGQDAVDALSERLLGTSLSLDHGPILQCTVVHSGKRAYDLILVVDHIVVDERSKAIIIGDLASFYSEPGADLGPAPQPYEFTAGGEVRAEDLGYWTRRLTPLPQRPFRDVAPLENPSAFEAGIVHFEIPALVSAALDRTAAAHRATPFSMLLAVYYHVLWEWTGASDLSVAVITDTRTDDREFDTVGFFQNPTVMRHTVRPEEPFGTLLDGVKRTVTGAIAHRHVPLSRIMADLTGGYGAQRNPLYQAGFAYSGNDIDAGWHLDGVRVENVPISPKDAQLEIYLEIKRSDGCYQAEVSHALGVIDPPSAERFSRRFREVVRAVVDDPGRDVSSLAAPAEERCPVG